ncbi:MAG: ABC transporter substrate-binding protein, partial [Ruthenibacterium sp.]
MKRIAALVLSVIVALSMVACGKTSNNSGTQQSANEDAVLKIGTTATHSGFNLFSQGGAYGKLNLERFGQEPLIGMDSTGEITPGFFQTYEINEENNQVVFTFPTDAKFQDGTTITLDDVLFSMESWMDKWSGRGYNVTVTESAPGTITCTLDANSAYSWLSYGAGQCYIAPKHVWENVEGEYADYTGELASIGAGPYKFVSYDEAAQVSYYDVFEDYYLGAPTIKHVELHTYSNAENLAMALKNGEVDAMYNYASPIPSTVIDVLRNVENLDLGQSDYSGNYQLTFGFKAEPTMEQSFREAVYYALDYDLLAVTIGGNEAVAAHKGMIPQGNKGFI